MGLNTEGIKFVKEVSSLLHADKIREAAKCAVDFSGLKLKIDTDDPQLCYPPLQHLLHWLLENNCLDLAASMLWSSRMFTLEPASVRQIWNLFDECSFGLIMSGGSLGKSFSMGARLFLEWIRDPEWTSVKLIGPSAEHLEANLFSHIVSLHRSAKLPMPGEIGELFIGLDRRNQLSSIKGVVIPVGKVKKAGRLQGTKRKPRPYVHPVFGDLSRLFIFIDEIENVPGGLWSDIDNVMSNLDQVDTQGLKIFGAFNPTNQQDEVGKRCEPPFGWVSFDMDKHFRWTSVRGWEVLRLDGERCENVVHKKIIFPGLQTFEGLDRIARNAGGRNSPGYLSMGRGAYPIAGQEMTIVPPGLLPKMRGIPIWIDEPSVVGGADLALEGKASTIFAKGLFGSASGVKKPATLEHPNGQDVMFRNESGDVIVKQVLMAEQLFYVPKGDTVATKDEILKACRKAGIKPEFLALDRTGVGAGVADLIKNEWASSIHDINYTEGASKSKIMQEAKEAHELYERKVSELWFALRLWGEFGYFFLHPQLSLDKLSQQLTQRRYKMFSNRSKVEAKRDYMMRTGWESPDEADALTLLVHAARMGSGYIPSMNSQGDIDHFSDYGWYGDNNVRIDPSNRTDYLLYA